MSPCRPRARFDWRGEDSTTRNCDGLSNLAVCNDLVSAFCLKSPQTGFVLMIQSSDIDECIIAESLIDAQTS
jgi:hypothetical protein